METAPTAELVYQGICTLFHNSNPKEKEKANKWLEDFQKSVSYLLNSKQNYTIYLKMLPKTNIIIADIFMDNCGRAVATETRFAFVLFCCTDDA